MSRPRIGDTYGRYTVIRLVHAARRRSSDSGVRARCEVRCTCGVNAVVWYQDLAASPTIGCRSQRCLQRWHMSMSLRRDFDAWLTTWLESAGAADREAREAHLPDSAD